jgi:phosphoribosylanthranilate isomerase
MNNIPIKICGLTREQDVIAAAAAGASAVGFVLYPASPRYVSPERAATLAGLLPAFVTPVLLFVNASAAEVELAAAQVPGAWLQFHGDETPDFCHELATRLGRRWIRAARIPKETQPHIHLPQQPHTLPHPPPPCPGKLAAGGGG